MNAIECLREIPRKNAEREFLIDAISGKRLTFGRMHQIACATASDLRRRGVRKGDRVAILLNNSMTFAELLFGCLYAGAVAVPINPILSDKEIGYIFENAEAKLVVVSAQTANRVKVDALRKQGCELLALKDGLAKVEVPDGLEAWDLEALPAAEGPDPLEDLSPTDTMSMVFTSGTTGRPSGVVHGIASLVGNARVYARRLGIGPENRFYGVLAMAHMAGHYNLLLLPYLAGASVVLSHAFDARLALRFWKPAKEHKVNTLWLVPTIIAILLETDRGREGEEFCREQVRLGLVGTAPLPVSIRREFEKRYGVGLFENYALSETVFVSSNSPATPVIDGCVGRILPGVQVAVKDLEGKPVGYGEEGEICVCTPHLMKGYYSLESHEIQPVEPEDWFPTGDIGILTGAGDLYITGRKKDLIIRGGINISPAQIEEVLYQHPAVAGCAAVGVYHAIYGEDIAVAVQMKKGHAFAGVRDDLAGLLKANLGPIKQPGHMVEIDEFPRSSTGKIQKAKVQAMLEHRLGIKRASTPTRPERAGPAPPVAIPARARCKFPRAKPEVLDKLRAFPISTVSSAMNGLGTMNASIRPLVPGRPFCGPALTVEEAEGGDLMSHAAMEWLEPGDVLVIDAKGSTERSCWGRLQTLMAKERRIAAVVINGAVRDYDDVVELGVPVYALGTSPAGPMKGRAGNINYPIACGGVVVNPGDVAMGDDNGVVVVPRDLVEPLLICCQQRAEMEKEWSNRVKAGESTLGVLELRQRLEQLNIRFE